MGVLSFRFFGGCFLTRKSLDDHAHCPGRGDKMKGREEETT